MQNFLSQNSLKFFNVNLLRVIVLKINQPKFFIFTTQNFYVFFIRRIIQIKKWKSLSSHFTHTKKFFNKT